MRTNMYVLAAMVLLSVTSCVSQKKFQAALEREQNLAAQNATLTNQNAALTNNINDLTGRIKALETENTRLVAQIDAAGKNASDHSGAKLG